MPTVLMPSTARPREDWLVVDMLSRLMDMPSSFRALFQGCRVCSSSHSVATCSHSYCGMLHRPGDRQQLQAQGLHGEARWTDVQPCSWSDLSLRINL